MSFRPDARRGGPTGDPNTAAAARVQSLHALLATARAANDAFQQQPASGTTTTGSFGVQLLPPMGKLRIFETGAMDAGTERLQRSARRALAAERSAQLEAQANAAAAAEERARKLEEERRESERRMARGGGGGRRARREAAAAAAAGLAAASKLITGPAASARAAAIAAARAARRTMTPYAGPAPPTVPDDGAAAAASLVAAAAAAAPMPGAPPLPPPPPPTAITGPAALQPGFYFNPYGPDGMRYNPRMLALPPKGGGPGLGALLPSGVYLPWEPTAGSKSGSIYLPDLLTRFDGAHSRNCGGAVRTEERSYVGMLDYYGLPVYDCDTDGYFMRSPLFPNGADDQSVSYDASRGDYVTTAYGNPSDYTNVAAPDFDPTAASYLLKDARFVDAVTGLPETGGDIFCAGNVPFPKVRKHPPLQWTGAAVATLDPKGSGNPEDFVLPANWNDPQPMRFRVLPKNLTMEETLDRITEHCAQIAITDVNGKVRPATPKDFVDNMCAVAPVQATRNVTKDYSNLKQPPDPEQGYEAYYFGKGDLKAHGYGPGKLGVTAFERYKKESDRLVMGGGGVNKKTKDDIPVLPKRFPAALTLTVDRFGADLFSMCNVYFLDEDGPTPRGAIFCHHGDMKSIYKHYPDMPIVQPPWTLYDDDDDVRPDQRKRWEQYMTRIVRAKSLQIRLLTKAEGGHRFFTDDDLEDIITRATNAGLDEFCPFEMDDAMPAPPDGTATQRGVAIKGDWYFDDVPVPPTGTAAGYDLALPGKQDVLYVIAVCASSRMTTNVLEDDSDVQRPFDNPTKFGAQNNYGAKLLQGAREFAQKAGIPTHMLSALRHVVGYYHSKHDFDLMSRHGASLEFAADYYRIVARKGTLYTAGSNPQKVEKATIGWDTHQYKHTKSGKAAAEPWTPLLYQPMGDPTIKKGSDSDADRYYAVTSRTRVLDLYYPREVPIDILEPLLDADVDATDAKAAAGGEPVPTPRPLPNLPPNEPLMEEFRARDLLYDWWVQLLIERVYRPRLGQPYADWPWDLVERTRLSQVELDSFQEWNPKAVDTLPAEFAEPLKREPTNYLITQRPTTYVEAFHRELFKRFAMDRYHFFKLHESLWNYVRFPPRVGGKATKAAGQQRVLPALTGADLDAIDRRGVVRDAYTNPKQDDNKRSLTYDDNNQAPPDDWLDNEPTPGLAAPQLPDL